FIQHGRLLVEDHPRHDHGAQVGRDQIEIPAVVQRGLADLGHHLSRVRAGGGGHQHEGEFEQAERDGDPLHRQVRAAPNHPAPPTTPSRAAPPTSAPPPAMPTSWVTMAPTQASIRVETDSQAQALPKRSAISSPCPRPVTRPSRTVSSWTMNSTGISRICSP